MQPLLKQKLKGQLNALPAAAITMVVIVIVVSMGVLILVGMNDSTTDDDASDNIDAGIEAMGTFSDWYTTIVIVVIAVVILGLVLGFFALRGKGGY